ncbi:MAG: hypothetical protein ACYDA0_05905 [Candidatus Dormibacteraceae bacterium]|jgi:hypothetical protein
MSVAVSPQTLAGAYGILLSPPGLTSDTKLELIRPDATIAASIAIASPSLPAQACGQGMGAWLEPPVSATNDEVYYRDGDTKIRMVVPPSSSIDVTTVPGNANVVSFFSVSPDDQRIAVLVEDLSAATTVVERLYVEDLRGGGHHSDIYTTNVQKGKGATTLWPMGWHQGQLVLGVWAACTFEQVPYPNAWHVVDATTALRQASIGDANCIASPWPSPAGAACFVPQIGQVRVYDWTGKLATALQSQTGATNLSPSGDLLFAGVSGPDPATSIISLNGRTSVATPGRIGCVWIDDSHVLAFDAVISYPTGSVAPLPHSGLCAGRFPGGL